MRKDLEEALEERSFNADINDNGRVTGTGPVHRTMSTRRCEECRAVLDPAKILRCAKCQSCFYCSKECQTRNWRVHKRVCSTDPLLRRYVPVEMAVERALALQPPMEQAPKDATYLPRV